MKLVIILPNNLGIMNINLMEVLLFSFKVPEGKLQVTLNPFFIICLSSFSVAIAKYLRLSHFCRIDAYFDSQFWKLKSSRSGVYLWWGHSSWWGCQAQSKNSQGHHVVRQKVLCHISALLIKPWSHWIKTLLTLYSSI
jgi:hypothetical protein